MLKERETYTATKGVENEGYEFEVGMLCFYCFHLCYNDLINDFKIAIYDDQYLPFDDIVIDVTTEATEKYAIQLKHVKDKLVLNSTHFGKNGKMVLCKYFKYDFSRSDHVVLLTNGVVNEEITYGGYHIKRKPTASPLELTLDTSCDQENHIYEIWDDATSNKITFFTSQKNRHDIDKAIKQKFKEKFGTDNDAIVQNFKRFFQQWKKGSYGRCKLDKGDIMMKIAETLFYNHIYDFEPQFKSLVDRKVDLLQKVLNSFNITIVDDVDKVSVDALTCFTLEKENLLEDGQEFLIVSNATGNQELAIILWRMKKFPLILKINDNTRKVIFDLIDSLKNENLSFILVNECAKDYCKIEETFQNLKNLEKNEYYESICQEFKISIQGQEELSLKEIIKYNPNFSEVITTKELFSISTGHFVIGEVEEPLPQPYIPRRVFTTIIKITSIEDNPNDLFVISGPVNPLQQKLPKHKFLEYEGFLDKTSMGNTLPPKTIILCEQDAKSFATCLKYKGSNVHCFRLLDDDHLQLICSKEKSKSLRQLQVFQENELYGLLKNNINLICAGPGMGKLTILQYLRKNCPPGYWTVKIDFQEENPNTSQERFNFEARMKNCFKEVRRIMFFVCGISNLQSENLKKATELVQNLAKNDFKVWVFAEDYLKELLEKTFKVSAMCAEEFNEKEQKQFILQRLQKPHVDGRVEKILQSFNLLKNNNILGSPLHLFMLTEIFMTISETCLRKILTLTDIYKYFIKTKYQHYLKKVYPYPCNQILDDGIYYRTEQYKLAAASCVICDESNVEVGCDRNFVEQIEKTGDVVGIIFKIRQDGCFIFNQQTYADYFAALWLISNYQKVQNLKEFIFREDFKNILFMFNLEICKNYPSHIAVLYENLEQVQEHCKKIDTYDSLGRSVLHLACLYEIKQPKVQLTKGLTVFTFAGKEVVIEEVSTNKILNYLMDNVCFDPLQRDKLFGWNLLDYAFNMLNLNAIEKILLKFPKTRSLVLNKLDEYQDDIFTIIYYSVKYGYNNLLELASTLPIFLTALNMENCDGESLLFVAAKYRNHKIVLLLLEKGANINGTRSTYKKRGALHLAAENEDFEMVKLLLEKGAFPDIMDRYRNTPLHLASMTGAYRIVELLLQNGSDVNFADNFGRTSLQLAAKHGHKDVLLCLLDHGAQVDKCDRFGNSPLNCANKNKYPEIIAILSKEGATARNKSKRLSLSDVEDYTSHPLHWVASTGQSDNVDLLLSEKWDINDRDNTGRTPLYRAVIEKHTKLIELFISKEADVNIPDDMEIVPLCRAINNNDLKSTELLLKNNACVDVKDKFNYTPLHWATMSGNLSIVKLLLTKNPDIDAIDGFGRKPVNCAVENGFYNVFKLLEDNFQLHATAKERSMFLTYYETMLNDINNISATNLFKKLIYSRNNSLNEKINADTNNNLAFINTINQERQQITESFLEMVIKEDTAKKYKTSVLHWAAFTGNVCIIKWLTENNFDVDAIDAFGYNSLQVATMRGHHEVVSILIEKGCDPNGVDKCGNSALDWACKKGYVQCVQVLLENQAAAQTMQGNFLDMAKKQHNFFKIAKFG